MNRNTEQHFALTPQVAISRSKFDRSHDHKTSFNNGELVPIYIDCTIMPGDTVKMDMSEVVRMMTPIAPVMDDMVQDIYFFFVPYRLVWPHFKRFMGENDTAPWTQTTEYEIPQIINYDSSLVNPNTRKMATFIDHSLADYMGYPLGELEYKASRLPFAGYCAIWNEFFRDENLQNPIYLWPDQDSATNFPNYTNPNYDEVTHAALGGGKLLKVCRLADYFSTCLPQAQKGNPVYVPLGTSAPVHFGTSDIPATQMTGWTENTMNGARLTIGNISDESHDRTFFFAKNTTEGATTPTGLGNMEYAGLYTDLSQAIGATVNQLRQAFAIQKYYERNAIGGTRYIEYVKAHYGVTNPDYRLQRPEYLGGKRIPINMNQVLQSTPTDGTTTPLGTTGAYSVTSDASHLFTHSFTEHGMLIGLTCCRTVHTYQQGLNAQFSKKKIFDFYTPEFANLGNMAVLEKELYLQGTSDDETAFGYQEAWAAERYFPNIVTASMRSSYSTSLDIWHYADNYDSAPSLGDTWIKEGKENVERTLAVQNEDQLFGDFYFKAIYTRPMPLYSIPGLIDHH